MIRYRSISCWYSCTPSGTQLLQHACSVLCQSVEMASAGRKPVAEWTSHDISQWLRAGINNAPPWTTTHGDSALLVDYSRLFTACGVTSGKMLLRLLEFRGVDDWRKMRSRAPPGVLRKLALDSAGRGDRSNAFVHAEDRQRIQHVLQSLVQADEAIQAQKEQELAARDRARALAQAKAQEQHRREQERARAQAAASRRWGGWTCSVLALC